MPVPVINSAFKVDPRPATHAPQRDEGTCVGDTITTGGEPCEIHVKTGAVADMEEEGLNGRIVLRHYYLGAARVKCLESALASVPVLLREVRNVYRQPHSSFDRRLSNVYSMLFFMQWRSGSRHL